MTAEDKRTYAQCADDHLLKAERNLSSAISYLCSLGDSALASKVGDAFRAVRKCAVDLAARREVR